MKRIISLALTLSIMLSCICVVKAADISSETAKQPGNDVLSALGIDLPHEYNMQDSITKESFVYLIMKGASIACGSQAQYLEFPDVKLDAWSHDAIVTARAMGFVEAKSDKSFGINDTVSTEYAADMAMKILGFEKVGQPRYPRAYSNLVYACGNSRAISYSQAFDMVYTMLLCPYVDETTYNKYSVITDKTFMEHVFDVQKVKGRLTGNRYSRIGGGNTGLDQVEIDGVSYLSNCGDMNDYLGFYADFFIYDNDSMPTVISYDIRKADKEYYIGNGDLTDAYIMNGDVKLEYEENNRKKKLSVPLKCDLVYNGVITDFSLNLLNELINDKSGEIHIVEYNGIFTMRLTVYETVFVSGVSALKRVITGKYGEQIELPEWEQGNNHVRITKEDKELSFTEIKSDDVLMIAANGPYVEIVVLDHIIAGVVNRVSDEDISVDDVKYDLSPYYINTASSDEHKLTPGIEANFYFDKYGQLVDFDDDDIKYPGEYVFLIKAWEDEKGGEYDCGIRIVTMDVQMQNLVLADKVSTDIGKRPVKPEQVVAELQGERGIIYIEKNLDGEVFKLFADGSQRVSLDAPEKNRKFKRASGAFLFDTNDAHYPEFYTNDNIVALQVPISTASSSDFNNIKNYKRITLSAELKDADDAVVQAYNFDDFKRPEIVLLRKEMVADPKKNSDMCIVTKFKEKLNEDGENKIVLETYHDGIKEDVVLDEESVLNCNADGVNRSILVGDIVRFYYNSVGEAFASEWISNMETGFTLSPAPKGRNDGNTYVVGIVDDLTNGFVKIRLAGDETYVWPIPATIKPTIYNSANGKINDEASSNTLIKGDLVMMRVYYTSIQDVIVKTKY